MVAEFRQGDRALMLDSVEVTASAADLNLNDGLAALLGSVAVAADVLPIPVTHRHVAKTTGADAEALTLANGVAGQRLSITLVTDGGGDGTITPVTATGFSTIVLADKGDNITLEYINDTVGWVVIGSAGLAGAPPAITLA